MIEYRSGNLLKAKVEALVNTVNTVGIMGKGIALQFRQAFPDNYKAYRSACDREEVQLGKIFVFERLHLELPHFILNFPTKKHWRSRSKLIDIEAGLSDLVRVIRENGIKSVAVPPLGCGNGGLDWTDVGPLIQDAMGSLEEVEVLVYPPRATPRPEEMPVQTSRPNMTPTRAAMLALLRIYAEPGYRVGMLEMQKLAYFLQVAGEPMGLNFARGKYGPYAEVLHHVLQRLEGHFLRGYGDRTGGSTLRLTPEAEPLADKALNTESEVKARLERVRELIEGFETPYGLELLATVHYLATEAESAPSNAPAAAQQVRQWSSRKEHLFRPEHVEVAWNHLTERGWLPDRSTG